VRQSLQIIALAGGWKGPINVEFKRHEENGKYYVMEANCRLNGYSYLTTMNGMDFPAAVIDLLWNGSVPRIVCPPTAERRNFILGFREYMVPEWCAH
jgi:predicted ATP-grasp superfamily ATP-dependent carboligase